MGSPAHTHAVISRVFIYVEFLLGTGVSDESETALALRKHKFKSLRQCLPTHQVRTAASLKWKETTLAL